VLCACLVVCIPFVFFVSHLHKGYGYTSAKERNLACGSVPIFLEKDDVDTYFGRWLMEGTHFKRLRPDSMCDDLDDTIDWVIKLLLCCQALCCFFMPIFLLPLHVNPLHSAEFEAALSHARVRTCAKTGLV
jgi:hypothetical protein